MKVIFDIARNRKKTIKYLYYAIAGLLLSLIQVIFLDFISVGGITPDLLIILIVWIALSEGQFEAIFAGFLLGLLFDVISNDIIGMNALVKTIVAFTAGYFYKEGTVEQNIGSFRFLIVVFIVSIIHNLIYFFLNIKLSELSFFAFFARYGVAMSLYTTVFAIFAMLVRARRKRF